MTTNEHRRTSRQLIDPVEKVRIRELLRCASQPPADLPSTISALAEALARYDVELTDLQRRLDQLTMERGELQVHYDACQALRAPIRRLPSELIVEIFALTKPSFVPEEVPPFSMEIQRLANTHLLSVSQVCIRWHRIAMRTASLWGAIDLGTPLWTDPAQGDKVLSLLRSALDRSATHPLFVTVKAAANKSLPIPVLKLLAEHSERWKTATFTCSFDDLQHLRIAKGNIPRLESLTLSAASGDASKAVDIFHVAPSLTQFTLAAKSRCFAAFLGLPVEQMNELRILEAEDMEPKMAINLMLPRLPRGSRLIVTIAMPARLRNHPPPPSPRIAVNCSRLSFERMGWANRHEVRGAITRLMDGITLPHLTTMDFTALNNLREPLLWPHFEFIALAERSSFREHLTSLELHYMLLSREELVSTLSMLPALERLSIADQQRGDAHLRLISNQLLTVLTQTSRSPTLVPHLRILTLYTTLQFTDPILLGLLVSRLRNPSDGVSFGCDIWWKPGRERDLDRAVVTQIDELKRMGRLRFSFSEAVW
ncbi:hypothetical protein C8R43DRAFT_1174990 [Mycena crocata]|nr:hypothetical protein C8R43DRAFT_1174990 [Mycena crocata]